MDWKDKRWNSTIRPDGRNLGETRSRFFRSEVATINRSAAAIYAGDRYAAE